jgi:ribosomal protein L37AE/L43A
MPVLEMAIWWMRIFASNARTRIVDMQASRILKKGLRWLLRRRKEGQKMEKRICTKCQSIWYSANSSQDWVCDKCGAVILAKTSSPAGDTGTEEGEYK